ncbi:hypothetical protein G6F56_006502 [Rhizopus delemar]|uniref:C2H2-type domain-containing protein n=1 Tax=Rhizopus stolonifer TaxID=4846 RepID=A0A367J5N3_RHIST|nr:hypothetical protein G6F56_006502 [Rhizopus delemar]RCH85205.1 hypothetical protein CU098_008879 [Rhizopus stolonifer]
MPHTKNPSLPSIQFLLNNENNRNSVEPQNSQGNVKKHHRQSHSISSLPSELQQLSISGPSLQNDIPNTLPSWMAASASGTPNLLVPLSTSSTRRPPGASHTRSISDFSLVHPVQTTPPPPVLNHTRERHQTHRRTVSANTTINSDFCKSVTPNNLPFINELPHRARTVSPPLSNHLLSDALNMNATKMVGLDDQEEKPAIERDEQTGKYYCPYCKKPFNRPSSLRIHTYSHTGEKPFVCSEEGCGRQFSVQSNMRRHLRVHKLGRSSKNVTK